MSATEEDLKKTDEQTGARISIQRGEGVPESAGRTRKVVLLRHGESVWNMENLFKAETARQYGEAQVKS